MSLPGDTGTSGGAGRTGTGARKKSREKSRKKSNLGKARTDSKKKSFEENPIRTKEELAKRILLGEIQFKNANSRKGVVVLEGALEEHIKSVWTTNASEIDISHPKLGALHSMSRPDKRKMLRELAEKGKESIEVKGSTLPDKFGTMRSVSLATVLVLQIGLQKNSENYAAGKDKRIEVKPDALFAELVGCADADTIRDLSNYLCPPLLTLERLPDFIHCATRQIARSQKEDRSPEPVALAIQTVNAISAALEQLNEEKKGEEKKEEKKAELKFLSDRTLSKAHRAKGANEAENEAIKKEFSRDLGCHAGLLLAGVQRYICKAQGSVANKKELCDLFIDASSGLLTGVPVAGFVFGPLGTVAKFGAHKWYFDDKAKKLGQLSRGVRQHFDESIAAPIFFDGEFVKIDDGKKEIVDVGWEEFSKWYDQVISWNEMQNEVIEWDEKKKRKEEKKKKRKRKEEKANKGE